MRKYFSFSLLIVMIIMLSLGGVNLTQAQQKGDSVSPTNVNSVNAKMPWFSEYVHHVSYPNDVGAYASLALRPVDDLPYISYYDAANGDLMLAHYVKNGGGNCGTNNKWHCDVLDGVGGDNVGTYTSLDFWADVDNNAWRIGISYHDATNRALKFTSWTCYEAICTIHNTITIASTTMPFNDGLYTSFKFAPDGTPYIAYYVSNVIGDDSLHLAHRVDSGGNCGEGSASGKWECELIDAGDGVGQYASMDLTYEGAVNIAYYDAGNGNLKFAWWDGFSACHNPNGWGCSIIEGDGAPDTDVGLYASLIAQRSPLDTQFRIAYYDKTNGQLKYYQEGWEGETVAVDDMGTSTSPMGISMDVDKDGAPIIAYQKVQLTVFSRPTLNIARPYFVYDDGAFGNCGETPPGYLFTYWRCRILDNAGQNLSEANYVSVAVRSSGLAEIAYSEFYDFDIGDHATSLKFITQRFQAYMPLVTK
jgi:hypothetical protein